MDQSGVPNVDTAPGSHAWVLATTLADTLEPSQANQTLIARRTLIKQRFGTKLDEYGNSRGLPRLQGSKSFGVVRITTSTGGTTLGATQNLTNLGNGIQYTATVSGFFADQALVTIQSVALGSDTNAFPGTKLRWDSPSAGLAPDCVVVADANGAGLTGGGDIESDESYQNRLIDDLRNPQGNGNRSEVRAIIQETSPNLNALRNGHGIPVECGFVYPCALGAGSLAFTFTVPGKGLGRLPSGAQLAAVEAYLKSAIGEDYSVFTVALAQDTNPDSKVPAISVKFSPNVVSWVDLDPFPLFYGSTQGFPVINAVTNAASFQIAYQTSYTGVAQPRVGQTICVYNASTRTFAAKRILSFTGTGPWNITVDTTNAASDTFYVPVVNQYVMPYSVKLDDFAAAIMSRYDALGPGENVASLIAADAELRGHRFPEGNYAFPFFVGTDIFQDIQARDDVDSAIALKGFNITTTAGSAGTLSYLVIPTDLGVYPG
jgi:Baseplate J-like protein